jgi:hypothetical protein
MKLNGFIGGAYTLRSKNLDAQRCVNLYPVFDEVGMGKDGDVAMLIGAPGLRLLLDSGAVVRALYTASNGILYAVCGNTLYSISSSWVKTSLGTLSTTSGLVSIADNGVQMMLVDGVDGYIFTFSSLVFATVTDADMPQASYVKFIDGYFILNQANTGRFWITSLYDGLTIDSLDFATAEGSPDNLLAIEVLRRQAWLFGTESIQVYFDSGDVDFPLSPINGVFIETGIAAAYSLAKIDQTLFWLGKNKDGQGVVYMASGYQPQRISTTAIEFAIQGYGDISSAAGFGYQQEGETFYVLNFSTTSWVYGLATRMWHERAYFNNGLFERYRANTHAYFNNTHVVGDYSSGKIYALDLDYYTDDAQPRKWLRAAPHITNELKYLTYDNFQVDLEFGVGTNTGQGVNPIIVARTSNDGGHSWGNERYQTMGLIGQYKARANFSRCGRSRDRVFEVSGTDPVKVALLGAYIEVREGSK